MTKERKKGLAWLLATAGAIIGLMVGCQALGLVLPWQAISSAEAHETFETKEHARETLDHINEKLGIILKHSKGECHE